ncbi:hypothetical protein AgCh_027307 [Apium graveolens]
MKVQQHRVMYSPYEMDMIAHTYDYCPSNPDSICFDVNQPFVQPPNYSWINEGADLELHHNKDLTDVLDSDKLEHIPYEDTLEQHMNILNSGNENKEEEHLILSEALLRPYLFTRATLGFKGSPKAVDFYEDLFEELSKYSEFESLNICDNLVDHMVGNVYDQFREEEYGAAAVQGLTGRFYAG